VTPLDLALRYVARGWNPLPIPHRMKKPVDQGWQHRVITEANAATYFSGERQNVGVILGPTSRGLTDLDLDCAEAIEIASAVLPPTNSIFGRASKRNSHRLYYSTLAPKLGKATLQFKDPTNSKVTLLEVRVGGDTGAQTVFPGSVHESGEPIKWEEDNEPAHVDDDELLRLAKLLAALCLLARHWPSKPGKNESGGRHDEALTVGGFLARCGFKPAFVKTYVEFVARAAKDEEVRDRMRAAQDAAVAFQKDEKTRDYPALEELFGEKIAKTAAEWLDYQGSRDGVCAGVRHQAEHSGQADKTDWRTGLICTKTGIPKSLLANAIIALRGAESWQSVLAFDVFAHQTMLKSAPPWVQAAGADKFEPRAWTDQDDIAAAHWLQTEEAIAVTPAVTAQAVELVARDCSCHPVQDYLRGLEHDGTPRLDTMLATYFGADQSEYTRLVGRMMMISAVARIFNPGCKVDTVPILEGPQGLKKSTAIKTLFAPWFTDDIEQFGSKDASMQCAGVWCVEVGELDAMSTAETSKIKAFISRTDDRFRPPYGRRVIEQKRSCIFIGTTNENGYLKDPTGARRFLPVKVTGIHISGLRRDRDMLWAEARAAFEAGEPWWFTDDATGNAAAAMAKDEQEARYRGDPWERLIADWLDSRVHQPKESPAYQVTIELVFRHAIGIHEASWDQVAMNRVARCMRRLGWERKQVTVTAQGETKRVWMYVRQPTEMELGLDIYAKSNVTTLRRPAPVAADAVVTQESAVPQAQSPLHQ